MLRIGVIGYNRHLVESHIIHILGEFEENSGKRIRMHRNGLKIDDGSEYIILNNIDASGLCLDQIIIADDYRWGVYEAQEELICFTKQTLGGSCVPEEFQVITMEL